MKRPSDNEPNPMIGTSLSHFKITAKLGEGGMGEVCRATDTKLGRSSRTRFLLSCRERARHLGEGWRRSRRNLRMDDSPPRSLRSGSDGAYGRDDKEEKR